jgi:DNA primase
VQTLSAEQRRYFEAAALTYQADLSGDTSAQEYLKGRGFGPEAAATCRLGVVHRPLVGHEQYAGRLAIPYQTPNGVVNMRFRCLKAHDCKADGCPRYLGMDGVEPNLYGVLDLKKDSSFICVTEGEIDRDTLSVLCDLPAVGVPGVENWQPHFSKCLDDFETIYVFADGDKAGRSFGRFLAREAKARPARLPKGEDVNSLYCKEGADGLRRLIQ